MWMEYNLRIPQDKRYKFAHPLDKLISGRREETLLKIEDIIKNYIKSNLSINLYIVGDIVTKDFLANQFLKTFIKLCIIDEKTQRKKIYIETENFEEIVELENPQGTIQKESWSLLKNIIKNYIKSNLSINFYIVGDIVTKDFLANEFLKKFIKLSIIDEKTQRTNIYIETEIFDEIFELENPEGTIQKESWSLLKTIVESKKKTLLKITKGEEDLLVLPLVLELPLEEKVKNFVFYGQPPITDARNIIPEGIVLVDVNLEIQNKVKKYINLMEKF